MDPLAFLPHLAGIRIAATTSTDRCMELPGGPLRQVSRPSDAGRGRWGNENLPGAGRDCLVHMLDATPFGCEQEERLAVWATQHGAKDRSVVFDPL